MARARWQLAAATVAMSLLGSLAAAELLLRIAGHEPWRYLGLARIEPRVNGPDERLGWRSQPGRYRLPAYSRGGAETVMTIAADGSRATGRSAERARRVWLVGGSYTLGWAVADRETFAAGLERRLPDTAFANHAVLAWGTLQSLLWLEEALPSAGGPDLVAYGLIEDHERRNVASAGWLYALELFSERGTVAMPYVTLDPDAGLVRHPLHHYPHWPLREQLALVALVESRWNRIAAAGRHDQGREATRRLLLEMDQLVASRGSRLVVLLLSLSPQATRDYSGFLAEHGVAQVDCSVEVTPALQVPGEGHPNAKLHERWAACMAPAFDRLLTER